MHPLHVRLSEGPIVLDGAMGTMLYSSGVGFDECFDAQNRSDPGRVGAIHRAFIDAGSDVIETNSYGANRWKLETHGLSGRVRELTMASVRIAREQREISGRSVLIAGSVGPLGRTLLPIGTTRLDDARAVFQEQIEGLLEGGVDLLCIETIPSLAEMEVALEAAAQVSDLPIIAMMTFAEDEVTLGGNTPADVARFLDGADIAAIGANCSVGPQRLLSVLSSMQTELAARGSCAWLACMPNAGWPAQIQGRVMYPSSPEYFAEFAVRARLLGISVIGGCCGTTPAHIDAVATALRGAASVEPLVATAGLPEAPVRIGIVQQAIESDLNAAGTSFAAKLGQKFVVAVEIDPPKGLNPAKALEGALMLKSVGVDAINVADSPMARVRMSALTMCALIQNATDVETIVHFTTRDRSLMGVQSELLGAHAVGVRNVLALTGDPPSLGAFPGSSAVYDIDSIGLIRILSQMNAGHDWTGASIGQQARFTIGCAVDPTRTDRADEARRLRTKIAAGAHFVMTQPIFSPQIWTDFLSTYGEPIGVPVLIGILPLQSSKHAEFLHNEVPGITLTPEARRLMADAGPLGRQTGVKLARELLQQLMPLVQGVYLMPSFGRYEVAAEVIDGIV